MSSGYKPEDVDDFIDRVKNSFEELMQKNLAQREEIDRVEEALFSGLQGADAAHDDAACQLGHLIR